MDSKKYPGAVGEIIQLGNRLSGDLLTCACDLHGVKTRVVTDSRQVAGAMGNFLRAFSTDEGVRPDIEVFLYTTGELDDSMAPVPASAPLLYDWGTVRISRSGPYRYENIDSRARVVADLENGIAAGFAENGLLQNDWIISNVYFYPLWAQLLKECGLFPLHAAGLAREGKSVLFLGKSGSGKSTLSVRLAGSGYGLLSDDTVFLREGNGVIESMSFPEEINVSEQTIRMIPELSNVSNFTENVYRQKSSFSIDELYPGCIVDSAVPSVLVFPELVESEDTSVEPMSRTEALTLSMRYGFFFMDPSTTGRHFEILSKLVRQAECFRLYSGSDQDQLGDAVDRLLRDNL